MYNFAFMLKTYREDFLYTKRLVETFVKYNVDNIHLFIVIEEQSINQLETTIPIIKDKNITIIRENNFLNF